MKKTNKNKKQIKIEKYIFIFSIFITMILGIFLTYNYNFENNFNLLFDSDTKRVIGDITEIATNHSRINVHPLFLILVQPIALILKGLVFDKMLTLVILSSLVTSLSVLYIYKSLQLIKESRINIILSILYLFTFSNIIFTSGIELYNYATLFLIMIFYYVIKKLKENKQLDNKILVILGILLFAVTVTNFVVFLIILFFLFVDKEINLKNAIKIVIVTLLLSVSLNITQRLIWTNAPVIIKTNVIEENNSYGNIFKLSNIKYVLENDYYNSLISSDIKLKILFGETYRGTNYQIDFKDLNILNLTLVTILFITIILLIIRNYTKNKLLNCILIMTIIFNTALHTIYGNNSTFLYSLHFVYLFILIFGLNLHLEENKKLKKLINIYVILFMSIEIVTNTTIYIKVINITNKVLEKTYFLNNLGNITYILEIFVLTLIIVLITFIIKQITTITKKNKINKLVSILISIFIIELTFITIQNVTLTNKFIIFDIKQKETSIKPISKLDTLSSNLKNNYKDEIKAYEEYIKEYNEVKDKYSSNTYNEANWYDYIFFGLGNREKYLFIEGRLLEIGKDKNLKVKYEFREKDHLIIPNIYTVLIETRDNELIKIYEDDLGVHIEKNNKDKIIKDTNIKINLYDFNNQKYKNTKKVLYNELLFNIKDSKIYPNTIVYENPWYRDAALACMVLKQTNNTDLIKKWVEEIEDIYDRQNKGNEEPDNLGELLYIISTQENLREDLIDKIEEEANRIAESNEKGYYLYGKTDYGDMYLYQNLWYKLGIESVNRDFKFDIENIEEDSYSSMTWWSNYEYSKEKELEGSREYPYLSYASRHKLKQGDIVLNNNLYPLSWEQYASEANYKNNYKINYYFVNQKISPLHTWSAAELLLFLMDETSDLNII